MAESHLGGLQGTQSVFLFCKHIYQLSVAAASKRLQPKGYEPDFIPLLLVETLDEVGIGTVVFLPTHPSVPLLLHFVASLLLLPSPALSLLDLPATNP